MTGDDERSDAITMRLPRIEAVQLARLTDDIVALLDGADATGAPDPALERLTPTAYPDDADDAAEFRSLTRADLVDSRRADAASVLASLRIGGLRADDAVDDSDETIDVTLDTATGWAWMRTLTALRLVLASRFDIDDEHPAGVDARGAAVYEWLAYRLETLVQALATP